MGAEGGAAAAPGAAQPLNIEEAPAASRSSEGRRSSCCSRYLPTLAGAAVLLGLCASVLLKLHEGTVVPGCTETYQAVNDVPPDPPTGALPANTIPLDVLPDVSDSSIGMEQVKAWAKARTAAAEDGFRGSRLASPSNWASSIIYNLQVDRFNNGNLSNDGLNVPPRERESARDGNFEVLSWRHGGDIKGVYDRLGYLKDLGINTLWMTPIFQHDGSYHGYCTSDLTEVDPGFGTKEELRELVEEAHKLGIRVVLDAVVNHMCDPTPGSTKYDPLRQPGDPMVQSCAERIMDHHRKGEVGNLEEQGRLAFSDSFFPPFRKQEFFNRCGPNTQEQMESESASSVFGDFAPTMLDYNTRDRDWQELFTELLKYWIAYLDVDGFRCDAAKHVTEDFLAYFATETRAYAESLGKDNFLVIGEVAASVGLMAGRLGAAASDPADPRRVDPALPGVAAAASAGGRRADDPKPLLGVPRTVTKRLLGLKPTYEKHAKFPLPGLGAEYNFFQSGRARAVLGGTEPISSLQSYFDPGFKPMTSLVAQLPGYDCCEKSPEGCTGGLTQFWTLLEIHDWPRFQRLRPGDAGFGTLGLAWLFTAPGQPIIHYGQEQGFNGLCPGSDRVDAGGATPRILEECQKREAAELNRQDMFESGPLLLGSAVPSVGRLARVGRWTPAESRPWREDPMLDRSHELYQTARKLSRLRQSCPVLLEGRTIWRARGHGSNRRGESASAKWMAFSRLVTRCGPAEAVVILNPGASAVTIGHVEADSGVNPEAGKRYVDVLNPSSVATIDRKGSKAQLRFEEGFTVKALGFRIFMAEDLVEVDAELGIAMCTPRASAGCEATMAARSDRRSPDLLA